MPTDFRRKIVDAASLHNWLDYCPELQQASTQLIPFPCRGVSTSTYRG